MWAYESVFYQIYPLGFCGAPFENDGIPMKRILKIKDWIPHLEKLGVNAIYFSPLFESDTHGYNATISRKSAMLCMKQASVSYWTVYSTMPAEDSLLSRMYCKTAKIPVTVTGSTLISMEIPVIMTVFGMKVGKAIMIW